MQALEITIVIKTSYLKLQLCKKLAMAIAAIDRTKKRDYYTYTELFKLYLSNTKVPIPRHGFKDKGMDM